MRLVSSYSIAAALLWAACSDDAASQADADAAAPAGDVAAPDACGTPGGAAPRFDPPPSGFALAAGDGFVAFAGMVYRAPPLSHHVETARQGQCRLLEYTPSLCTPTCDDGGPCLAGVCHPPAEARSVGTVTLTGVGVAPVAVEPSDGFYYWTGEALVDDIALSATGGGLGPFTLATCAVSAPTPIGDWGALLDARAAGADATLRWSDPVAGARVHLRMTTGIGTHGGLSPVEVECEGPDTGALTLPGAYLDALYAQGWSCGECGDNHLQRYHAAETTVGGTTLQLRAQSTATFFHRP